MRTVPLHGKKAAGRVALVDDEDYELVSQYRWHALGGGHHSSGPYACAKIWHEGRDAALLMHRLLMPGIPEIDHVDGDGLNCQRCNLRPATRVQNMANTPKRRTWYGRPPSSAFKGVAWNKNHSRWHASIGVDGRRQHLGYFADEIQAALAYDAAALAAWGEYAWLNFPGG